MSTKTMRLPPRRVVTPSSNKRKDPEEEDGRIDAVKPSESKKPKTETDQARLGSASNQLLAGYLAHEYLTKGTLFGRPWDASRAEAASGAAEPCAVGGDEPDERGAEPGGRGAEPQCAERLQRYVAVADLITADGSHLPGVVNPAQLARLLRL